MEDFVPFEIANKLKKKGFNEKTFGFYSFPLKLPQYPITYVIKNYNKKDNFYSAPTISQVLKWLREEKKISIEVGIHCSLKWMCSIYGFSDGLTDFTQYSNDGIDDTVYILYDSYELASLAGIEYVIDNLI